MDYTWQLELQGRYKHTLWPDHCLTGPWVTPGDHDVGWLDISDRDINFRELTASHGQEIIASIHEAIQEWQTEWKKKAVNKVVKTVDIGERSSRFN